MTILDLIKAACKTKGVPEKYAERIQKTFKIEKAEGMEAFCGPVQRKYLSCYPGSGE